MTVPSALQQLAQQNPIVYNGLQLHLAGGASLDAALIAIIEALVELNEQQQIQFLKASRQCRPAVLIPVTTPAN